MILIAIELYHLAVLQYGHRERKRARTAPITGCIHYIITCSLRRVKYLLLGKESAMSKNKHINATKCLLLDIFWKKDLWFSVLKKAPRGGELFLHLDYFFLPCFIFLLTLSLRYSSTPTIAIPMRAASPHALAGRGTVLKKCCKKGI